MHGGIVEIHMLTLEFDLLQLLDLLVSHVTTQGKRMVEVLLGHECFCVTYDGELLFDNSSYIYIFITCLAFRTEFHLL